MALLLHAGGMNACYFIGRLNVVSADQWSIMTTDPSCEIRLSVGDDSLEVVGATSRQCADDMCGAGVSWRGFQFALGAHEPGECP